jgi:hypothetical protein
MFLPQSFDLLGQAIFGFQDCPFLVLYCSSHFLSLLFLLAAPGSLPCVSSCGFDRRLIEVDYLEKLMVRNFGSEPAVYQAQI